MSKKRRSNHRIVASLQQQHAITDEGNSAEDRGDDPKLAARGVRDRTPTPQDPFDEVPVSRIKG